MTPKRERKSKKSLCSFSATIHRFMQMSPSLRANENWPRIMNEMFDTLNSNQYCVSLTETNSWHAKYYPICDSTLRLVVCQSHVAQIYFQTKRQLQLGLARCIRMNLNYMLYSIVVCSTQIQARPHSHLLRVRLPMTAFFLSMSFFCAHHHHRCVFASFASLFAQPFTIHKSTSTTMKTIFFRANDGQGITYHSA